MGMGLRVLDGMYVPVVRCDHCKRVIERVEGAVYAHRPVRKRPGPKEFPVLFLHFECFDVLDKTDPRGHVWGSNSLAGYLIQLGHNLGMDWAREFHHVAFNHDLHGGQAIKGPYGMQRPKTKAALNRQPISPGKRWRVFIRDGFTCQHCFAFGRGVVLEIDHRIPVSRGGNNEETNLLTACWACNRGRRDGDEW